MQPEMPQPEKIDLLQPVLLPYFPQEEHAAREDDERGFFHVVEVLTELEKSHGIALRHTAPILKILVDYIPHHRVAEMQLWLKFGREKRMRLRKETAAVRRTVNRAIKVPQPPPTTLKERLWRQSQSVDTKLQRLHQLGVQIGICESGIKAVQTIIGADEFHGRNVATASGKIMDFLAATFKHKNNVKASQYTVKIMGAWDSRSAPQSSEGVRVAYQRRNKPRTKSLPSAARR